jgi:two-component system vancomycin resistance associated response regulator VraR
MIVDDQTVPRQLFERIIAASDRYETAVSLDTAKVAYAWCAKLHIDLILMDVVMNDGYSGLESAARIKEAFPSIKIIIVTSMPDAFFMKRAREIGVDSFWYKEVQAVPMLEVMDRTMAGEHIWPDSPPVTALGLAKSIDFTDRELDVLRLLAEGMTDKEIADALFVSVTTVRYHVGNLMGKTGFSSRTELAVKAVRSGITIPI